ncbi:MAG: translesion DNA synthesis-associated protein ImuA [Xanthomonadales bacterium]|nr:translesion DNA synthesis-associated protein ImuA [Xanthomonadales bacterium]
MALVSNGRPGPLDELLRQRGISRGYSPTAGAGLPCEHPDLEPHLPRGWPVGELTEVLAPYPGIGELSLLAPALTALTRRQQWVALVAPPQTPHASGLRQLGFSLEQTLVVRTSDAGDALWATEQVMRSGACGAVLCWPGQLSDRQLRRLQLAAEQGRCSGVIFRHLKARHVRSPAALRLTLEPNLEPTPEPDPEPISSGSETRSRRSLRATIIKRRGGRPGSAFTILTCPPA